MRVGDLRSSKSPRHRKHPQNDEKIKEYAAFISYEAGREPSASLAPTQIFFLTQEATDLDFSTVGAGSLEKVEEWL